MLQQSLGVQGAANPQEIKARFRTLAQRCARDEATAEEHERLRPAAAALAQELSYLGYDVAAVEGLLAAEGCAPDVSAEVAASTAGPIARRVHDPLERRSPHPEDEAYARLATRLHSAEHLRTATLSSFGFGFIVKLAVAFVLVIVALVMALDFFPRLVTPQKAAPQAPQPVPIQLVPPEKAGK